MEICVSARAFVRASSAGRRLSALALLVLLALPFSLAGAPCAASEIVVKNDSMPPAGNPLPGVSAPIQFGVWLDAPVDGTIVGVQILWGSKNGGAAPAQHVAIHLAPYDPIAASSGTPWASIDSPVLLDSGVNEYRYLDPSTKLQPLAVPIRAGDSFLINLELNPQQIDDPSILMDTDGLVSPARSLLQFNGSGWGTLALGVFQAGDLGIRAIIQPVPEPSTITLFLSAVFALSGLKFLRVRKGR